MTQRINLEDANVFVSEMTMEQARMMEEEQQEEVAGLIDQALGHVHMGNSTVAYAIIVITK